MVHVGCCIVIALVIGLGRRVWFGLVPGAHPAEPGFAPPAARPAPGPARPAQPGPGPRARPATTSSWRGLLPFVAAGAALYTAAVALLTVLGAATGSNGAGWVPRDVLVVAVALGALLLGRHATVRASDRVPFALIGCGSTWLLLGLLDMHVFGLFDIAHGAVLPDLLFHGSGSAATTAGLLLRLRLPTWTTA